MSVVAIIPARGGSKGVPKKNIALLGGYPLIAYSIIVAKLCPVIDRTIVSTDSEEIAEISSQFGAEVPYTRPSELAQDTSGDLEFIAHAMKWFRENEGKIPDYLIHLRPTTPLRDPAVLTSAVNLFIGRPEATSLRSGHPAAETPFKWFLKTPEDYFRSISPEYSNEFINRPRQSFPQVYVPDGYVDIIKTAFVATHNILHGEKMLGFISPECHEVDTPKDFEYLEFEILRKGSVLRDYLKQNFGEVKVRHV